MIPPSESDDTYLKMGTLASSIMGWEVFPESDLMSSLESPMYLPKYYALLG